MVRSLSGRWSWTFLILWVLCRRRHKVHYADVRIMPTSVRSAPVSRVLRANLVGIIQAPRDCSSPAPEEKEPRTVRHRERVIVPQLTLRTQIYLRRSDGPREVAPKRAVGSRPAPGPYW